MMEPFIYLRAIECTLKWTCVFVTATRGVGGEFDSKEERHSRTAHGHLEGR